MDTFPIKRTLPLVAVAACACLAGLTVPASAGEKEATLHAVVELRDGSRLLGTPVWEKLRLRNAYGDIQLAVDQVREIGWVEENGTARLLLDDGDRVTGSLPSEAFPLQTCLGKLGIPWTEVETMRFSMRGGPAMPAGEGPLSLGGINWTPMRVAAEARDGRLVTLPKAREGFRYGHSGNGRGATLVSNVGNPEWRDYRVEFDAAVAGIDPAFNPYRIQSNQVGLTTYFHAADFKESWNQKGLSSYSLSINPAGKWALRCTYNQHCPSEIGYKSSVNDGLRTLAEGQTEGWKVSQPKRIAIEVVGKRIQVWVDGKELADVRDEDMDKEVGGVTLDHGGIGVQWGWEGMGWIGNLSVERR